MERSWPAAFSPDVVAPFLTHLSVSIVALEAWRRGLTVTLLDARPRRIRVEDDNGRSVEFTHTRPEMSTIKGVRLAGNKYKTTTLLAKKGFSTPVTRLVDTAKTTREKAAAVAADIGYPVVLKPLSGSKGRGVFTGIADEEAFLGYYDHLVNDLEANQIVVESHEDGEMDLRVLVIGDQLVGIIHRVPANITGDGKHTVSELIDLKNQQRRKNPFLRSGLIKKDQEVINYAHAAGHTMTSIPAPGEYLRLRGKSNGSAGGDTAEVSHIVSEEIIQEVVQVVESFPGLYAAGVDILYTPAREGASEKYTLIEVNATPQIALNMYPMVGEGRDSPQVWIDACFPGTTRSQIPGEENLTFSLDKPLAALRAGTATRVTLPPVPALRLPYRSTFVYATDTQLQGIARRRLIRQALTHGISGELKLQSGQLILNAAADNPTALDAFLESASSLIKREPTSSEGWKGIVRQGFKIL